MSRGDIGGWNDGRFCPFDGGDCWECTESGTDYCKDQKESGRKRCDDPIKRHDAASESKEGN